MGQSSGSVGPAIGGSPFGGLRVLSPMDIARASPQYDPYTASRRPNYMPYGPNQQFYQPIYQPSYSQFSPMGYGQAPFGGFYQPPMMGFGQRFGQPRFQQPQQQFDPNQAMHHGMFSRPMPRNMMPPEMFGPATDISNQGQAALRQMPQQFYQPMMPPPLQQQYRPIPYITQAQIDQRAAAVGGGAPVSSGMDGGGGGYGDGGFGGGGGGVSDGGGYSGPGSVGAEGATASGGMGPGDDGGGVGSDGGGVGMGGDSTGEGVFQSGGRVRKPSYGGIDSLLRK